MIGQVIVDVFQQDINYIKSFLDFIVNHSQTKLPQSGPNGTTVQWQIESGHCTIQDGVIYKTPDAAENEPISLVAKLTSTEGEESHILFDYLILKDAYTAHVMSYFNHSEGKESGKNPEAGMRLAYSYDGLDWMPLNNGKGILNEKGGTTNWLRDPHIFRKKDGTFGVAATQGWDTPYIFLWESVDLVDFEEHYLRASLEGPANDLEEQNLTGKRAWAPKVMYDPKIDQYYVFWSDPMSPYTGVQDDSINRPLYYNTTKDLKSLSKPGAYFDAGYRVIDASIVKDEGFYYMFYKDERVGQKTIKVAVSESLNPNSFRATEVIASNPEERVEGPFAFRSVADGKWYLYYDDFADKHTYGCSTTDTLSSHSWEIKGVVEGLPIHKLDYKTRISHGGQITVTKLELERIIAAWDK